MHGAVVFLLGMHGLLNGNGGNDIPLTADPDNDPIDDRQGQGQTDHEEGALAGLALHLHLAPQLFHRFFHHIHAYAPTGNIGNLVRRGEAWKKNKVVQFKIRQGIGFADQTALNGFFPDFLGVEALAIVLDLDHHAAALLVGAEIDGAGFRLAELRPVGRGRDAMVHGVSHHVDKRVIDRIHHVAVNLGVGAFHDQVNLFP